ncbi:cation:proton antiporter [Vibrio breoganii]|uniref:monovalent cation/H+ antiporter complex subunit F n=1 Tax=Vibrio breoganii TaxID=553239 RepID=UPI000C8582EA|nr:monovalent cation/H+ antiporter complex subunit F [Vibrio breoganii]PMG39659.1 cation:proton antiporter [Vibrio breoganii]PMM46187.1 cation:proton antiporter [Vibrio breoganii]
MDKWLIVSIVICSLCLFFSLAMAVARLIIGPTLADRVVALDLISFITIGYIALYTLYSGQMALLDIAVTLGLVAFLGTIAFARLIAKQSNEE